MLGYCQRSQSNINWLRIQSNRTKHCYPAAVTHPNTALLLGFPGGASGEELARQCRRRKNPSFGSWVGKIPRRRSVATIPVHLPGESHGQRSLEGRSPWACGVEHNWSDLARTHARQILQWNQGMASGEEQGFGRSDSPFPGMETGACPHKHVEGLRTHFACQQYSTDPFIHSYQRLMLKTLNVC